MMKNLLFMLGAAICFAQVPAVAQTFEWVRSRPVNFSVNLPYVHITTATDTDGNVLTAGLLNHTAYYGTDLGFMGDLFLTKYDRAGTEVFNKLITGNAAVKSISTTTGGDFYVVGHFNDSVRFDPQTLLLGSGPYQVPFLAKYSANGNLIYARNLRDHFPAVHHVTAFAVGQNGHLFAGFSAPPVSPFTYRTVIKKFDDAGAELLNIFQDNIRVLSSIAIDQAGNINAAGSCASYGSLFGGQYFTSGFSYDIYLASYTPAGAPRWVKFIQDLSCHNPELKADNAGHFYLAGQLFRDYAFGSYTAQGPGWSHGRDFFLVRADTAGNIKWLREVPQITTGDAAAGNRETRTGANWLSVDSGNNVYMAGILRNTIDWGDSIISTGTGNNEEDLLVLKYDSAGTLKWAKNTIGTGRQHGNAIAVNSFGEVFIAGRATGTVSYDTIQHSNTGNFNAILAKIRSQPVQPSATPAAIKSAALRIFPNPANRSATVVMPEKTESEASIVLYNAVGQIVWSHQAMGNTNGIEIDLSTLAPGLYIVQLKQGNKFYRHRLVRE